MELFNFDESFSQNLRCKLLSYHRVDRDFFELTLDAAPAYSNCLLSVVDEASDRIQRTCFVPAGCAFNMAFTENGIAGKHDFELIFFTLHSGIIPVFSIPELKPFILNNIEQISPFWSLLRYETINTNFLKDFLVELTLSKMAIFVLRDLNDLAEEQFARLRQNFSNERLSKIIAYVHEHLHDNISLEDLAKMVELSEDYISQFFKRAIGESIQAYAIGQRIKSGLFELVTTGASIQKVSDKTGFVDQAYFNRRFKKEFNLSPLGVRKNYRMLFKNENKAPLQNEKAQEAISE